MSDKIDILKDFGHVEITFDADRDCTNLDSMISYSKKLENKNIDLTNENAKLVEALEYYADSDNARDNLTIGEMDNAALRYEYFLTARKVLKEVKK